MIQVATVTERWIEMGVKQLDKEPWEMLSVEEVREAELKLATTKTMKSRKYTWFVLKLA